MSKAIIALVLLSVSVVGAKLPQKSAPTFNYQYRVDGVLSLPYAEIKEPFNAWVDAEAQKSRIDYYGGTVNTYQRADVPANGQAYKIAPITTEAVFNQMSCFLTNGTSDSPVMIQSVLPDLSDFTYMGPGEWQSTACDIWQNVTVQGDKVNKYTMWLSQDSVPTPLHYEMFGYDTLLGSHYDKYYVDYFNYDMSAIPASIFEVPNNNSCGDFPSPPGDAAVRVLANPMSEYFHGNDDHVDAGFEEFKKTQERKYSHEKEERQRKHIYRHNLRYVNSKNRANLGFKMAINHLADRSDAELKVLRGRRSGQGTNLGQPFDKSKLNAVGMPDTFDWRIYGAVTPVKDQAVCGSCWSFGTTGTIEGALFLSSGRLVRLSQQNLIDCSWGFGNDGCDGGEDFQAYNYIMKHGGLMSEESYGPYQGQDGFCHFDNSSVAVHVTGYVNITSGDLSALQTALYFHGPISVGIDASHKSFSFYSHGVYYEPECGNKPDQLDHSVLAVGYGVINGQAYWLVKNSWSTYWGNDGYVLMSQQDNNCGVATAATFVTVN